MTIECITEGGVTVAILSGRLDSGASTPALAQLTGSIDRLDPCLILDAANLEYVSSAALRTLLGVAKKIRASGGKIAIVGMQDSIREIFEISGFHSIIPAYADLEAARNALAE